MTFRGFKIHIILISFLLVVAIGFGVNKFVYGRHVTETVQSEFLALPGVGGVDVRLEAGGVHIVVDVEPDADLSSVYKAAGRVAERHFGPQRATVRLADDRTAMLESAYEHIHLALYEGAATGRFTAMARRVEDELSSIAGEQPVTYTLQVDDEAIYVSLRAGEQILYERIPRRSPSQEPTGGLLP